MILGSLLDLEAGKGKILGQFAGKWLNLDGEIKFREMESKLSVQPPFGLPTTDLRFFTVYGPWGRPDMALFQFTKAIIDGEPIQVFNNGEMERDFTYIDDVMMDLFVC